jgi:nitrous oxidase accessory protein NosD
MLTLRYLVLVVEAAATANRALWLLSRAPILLATCLLVSQPAYPLSCGDIVTADVKLTANLSPCPGNGLVVQGHNLTIDLNGHSIVGGPTATGILLSPVASHVTIKGPGEIATFGTGILLSQGTTYILIHDLTLYENTVGMVMSQTTHVRIMSNTIDGGSNGMEGVYVSEVNDVDIYRNTIKRHSVAGMMTGMLGSADISENTITGNQVGISYRADSGALRGNTITSNNDNGIQVNVAGPAGGPTIEDNQVLSNGGIGIAVIAGTILTNTLVQDNIVRSNKGNGISITGNTMNTRVTGNRSSGNATDLTWDGKGTSCWALNVFGTSSPVFLPACP